MPDKWTSSNVTVVPAPIAGQDRADELLRQYYEKSPTKLISIPMSAEEEGDITYYNILATQDAPKR